MIARIPSATERCVLPTPGGPKNTTFSLLCTYRIKRQRCLFHIEKYLAHGIKESCKEKDLDMAKRLIRYMFFQNEKNLTDLGRNREPIACLIAGKNEKQIVEIKLEKITSLYGYDSIISNFLSFLKRNRKEVFLYLQDPMVEKTSFWYHHYLSTDN